MVAVLVAAGLGSQIRKAEESAASGQRETVSVVWLPCCCRRDRWMAAAAAAAAVVVVVRRAMSWPACQKARPLRPQPTCQIETASAAAEAARCQKDRSMAAVAADRRAMS